MNKQEKREKTAMLAADLEWYGFAVMHNMNGGLVVSLNRGVTTSEVNNALIMTGYDCCQFETSRLPGNRVLVKAL